MKPDFECIIVKNFFDRKIRRHINQITKKIIQFQNSILIIHNRIFIKRNVIK